MFKINHFQEIFTQIKILQMIQLLITWNMSLIMSEIGSIRKFRLRGLKCFGTYNKNTH